jgi:hypothetical protein
MTIAPITYIHLGLLRAIRGLAPATMEGADEKMTTGKSKTEFVSGVLNKTIRRGASEVLCRSEEPLSNRSLRPLAR